MPSLGHQRKTHVAHVDVYLSLGDPYWPNEASALAASAGMGPITNAIGMNLTAVSVKRPVTLEPDPYGDVRGDTPLDQCVRGVAAVVDETSLLWLCEKVVPVIRVRRASDGLNLRANLYPRLIAAGTVIWTLPNGNVGLMPQMCWQPD